MSSVIAQKWPKEATVIPDEHDAATSTDGDLDNLMQTIKGIFHYVYYFPSQGITGDSQSHIHLCNNYPISW
jgi:hypothetical protein